MTVFRRLFAALFGLQLPAALAFAGPVAWLWITDYVPRPLEPLPVLGRGGYAAPAQMSLVTWNVGYGGLGAEQDFFLYGDTHGWPEPA